MLSRYQHVAGITIVNGNGYFHNIVLQYLSTNISSQSLFTFVTLVTIYQLQQLNGIELFSEKKRGVNLRFLVISSFSVHICHFEPLTNIHFEFAEQVLWKIFQRHA